MMRFVFILLFSVLTNIVNSQIIVNGWRHAAAPPAAPDTTYDATIGLFNICGGGCATVSGFTQLTPLGEPDDANHSGTSNGYTLASQTGGWLGIPASVGTSGATTSDGGGFYHGSSTANQSYYFNDQFTPPTTTTANYSFVFSGLTEDSLYCIDLVPSRITNDNYMHVKAYDKNGEGTVIHKYWNSTSDSINAKNNTSKYVRIFVRANSSGQAFLWIGGLTTSYFAYANTISIQKVTISPYPYAFGRLFRSVEEILAGSEKLPPLPHLRTVHIKRLVLEAILPNNRRRKYYV